MLSAGFYVKVINLHCQYLPHKIQTVIFKIHFKNTFHCFGLINTVDPLRHRKSSQELKSQYSYLVINTFNINYTVISSQLGNICIAVARGSYFVVATYNISRSNFQNSRDTVFAHPQGKILFLRFFRLILRNHNNLISAFYFIRETVNLSSLYLPPPDSTHFSSEIYFERDSFIVYLE